EIKQKNYEKNEKYKEIKNELSKLIAQMDQYKKFLTIFYKIYEQKASEFCGKDFKFKIFDFENYNLIEKFEVYYKSIEYNNLSPIVKETVGKILAEKFTFYD
ncbi:MAG: hypothetical protein ACI4VQ_05725, partial [Clostridia bacterium]